MRNAQRAILLFLLKSPVGNKRPSKTFLVKLLFLASREITEKQRGPFYDFLPYKYGPFSFVLYHDLSSLARDGWIQEDGNLRLAGERRDDAHEEILKMPRPLREGLENVWRIYGGLPDQKLISDVYSRYPAFTCLSETAKNPPPTPHAPIAIYTLGYEGASVDGFLNTCIQQGIASLLDVRGNPCSRKWGFSKKNLSRLCGKINMDYFHLPELGVPREERQNLDSPESYNELLDRYEKVILPRKKKETRRALEIVRARPTALVCMEADPAFCHRGRLAMELARVSGLPVHHLEPA